MYACHFWSLTMHPCTDSCDISFVLCTQNDLYAYRRQIRGVLLYSACIQIFMYKSFWCIDFHAKQCGTVLGCCACTSKNAQNRILTLDDFSTNVPPISMEWLSLADMLSASSSSSSNSTDSSSLSSSNSK